MKEYIINKEETKKYKGKLFKFSEYNDTMEIESVGEYGGLYIKYRRVDKKGGYAYIGLDSINKGSVKLL